MRLIDADVLLKEIEDLKITVGGKQILVPEAKHTILRIIDEQPTAFDTDKVIEQLEHARRYVTIEHSYYKEHLYAIDRVEAIKIVERGREND